MLGLFFLILLLHWWKKCKFVVKLRIGWLWRDYWQHVSDAAWWHHPRMAKKQSLHHVARCRRRTNCVGKTWRCMRLSIIRWTRIPIRNGASAMRIRSCLTRRISKNTPKCQHYPLYSHFGGRPRCHQGRAHRQPARLIDSRHLQLARPAPRHPATRREHRRGKENHGQVRSVTTLQTILKLRAVFCHRLTDQNL